MEQLLVSIGLGLLGLIFGSFSGATVWRLRAHQLHEDKTAGESIDRKEFRNLKKLLKISTLDDRSICLHCHHQLAWYDLLPLVSWLQLRGKCRYCRQPIGQMEPLIELGTAVLFVVSYLAWPGGLTSILSIVQFALWLIIGVGLVILFAYDSRWYLLPNKVIFPLIGLAAISGTLHIVNASSITPALIEVSLATAILSGLYYSLYVISRQQWVGLGDVKLGLILAFVLANWRLAFLTLFLANIIGCIIVIPGLLTKKLNRHSHIPFGPLLIIAYFIVGLFGQRIIDWYLTAFMLM